MSEFKVKFRGVRGSFPVADKRFMRYGGNTSCVEVNVGGHLIILDAGTGIVSSGDDLMESYISSAIKPHERKPIKATILLSHIHQDHLLGFTFFKPMHVPSTELEVFGSGVQSARLSENLSTLVFGKTFPLDLGDIACKLNINDVSEGYAIIIKPESKPELVPIKDAKPAQDDVFITFYKSFVHPQDGVMIYKISYNGKSLVYATDKECYYGGDKKFIQFAKNCDLLIHDAQYTSEDYLNPHASKQGFGHSTYDMAIEVMKQANAKNLAFFHYDPSYDDEKLNRIKEYYTITYSNVKMPYEGYEYSII